jgi:hypothetical protein
MGRESAGTLLILNYVGREASLIELSQGGGLNAKAIRYAQIRATDDVAHHFRHRGGLCHIPVSP